MVLLCIPIVLVVALTVYVVILIHLVIDVGHIVEGIILCSIFFIELFKTFLSVEAWPGIMSILMTLILLEEVVVVLVLLQAILNILLLPVSTLHSLLIGLRLLSFTLVLPVLVCLLIIKARTRFIDRAWTKDQSIILLSHVFITNDRIRLSDRLEILFFLFNISFSFLRLGIFLFAFESVRMEFLGYKRKGKWVNEGTLINFLPSL